MKIHVSASTSTREQNHTSLRLRKWMNRVRRALPVLALLFAFATLPAHAQLERVIARAVEGDIDCLPCAVTIELALKQVEGVDRISVSMSKQMVAITFKPGARFTPDKYREAISKAEVRVKSLQATMRGSVEQQGDALYFVAGQDRLLIVNPPEELPVGIPVKVVATVDDSKEPYSITSVDEVRPL